LIALAQNESSESLKTKFEKDGYFVEPWVVMVQAINHATEHREQIKSMLSSLGMTLQELMVGRTEGLPMCSSNYQLDRRKDRKYYETKRLWKTTRFLKPFYCQIELPP